MAFGRVALVALVLIVPMTMPTASGFAQTNARQQAEANAAALEQVRLAISRWRYDDALTILGGLLRRNPNDVNALLYLGLIRMRTHKNEEAEKVFAKALALSPRHTTGLLWQGQLFLNTDRVNEAEENLRRLQALCPQGCRALDQLRERIVTATDLDSTAY